MPPETTGYLPLGIAPSEQSDPLAAVLDRLTFWPVVTLGRGAPRPEPPIAIVLGFWAARLRILEQPGRHLPLLRRVALIGITIGWLGGLPHAAAVMGWLSVPHESMFVFEITQISTGLLAGLGYAALFGLLGHQVSGRRPGPLGTAVSAVGKRSLSAYLAPSILCAPVLAAWGRGLGTHLHSASGTWGRVRRYVHPRPHECWKALRDYRRAAITLADTVPGITHLHNITLAG